MKTTLTIPELSLVVLIGPSGSGKSTFARKHFLTTEILSSDFCRAMVSDDESSQAATKDAFDVLQFIARKRLAVGRLTVVDATNVRPEDRKPLVALARDFHCIPVAVVLDIDRDICIERNKDRPNRSFGPRVVIQQSSQLRRSLRGLKREGFRHIHRLTAVDEINCALVERTPLYSNKKSEKGPFDIIGDLHGCCDELEALLGQLGYRAIESREGLELSGGPVYAHPVGRKAIFLGDLGDRGLRILDCFRLVRNMVQQGSALCLPGNHDIKLMKLLRGKDVQIKHGLARTIEELGALPSNLVGAFREELARFIDGLVSHYVLDGGRLVVAHAGMKEEMQGRGSGKVREFALYGETTGETDEFGLPVRYNWAAEYRGLAIVVYGHTPVTQPQWLNNTINIDTGCVFGGRLTALRYPERELVGVPAARVYFEPIRPIGETATAVSAQHEQDDLLDIADVQGKRVITTRLRSSVTIREAQASAALEVMSRFAVNPKWLIYLPPTMSPPKTTSHAGLLEHPNEAFAYFERRKVRQVICEEKHMGSRAIIVLCCHEIVAKKRFGIVEGGLGCCYTRTGRPFFNDFALENEILSRLVRACNEARLWESLNTDWVCLDCELLPWSAKAQELIRSQYAAVGAAAAAAFPPTLAIARAADQRACMSPGLLQSFESRQVNAGLFVEAYRRYCWPVNYIADLKVAPFHILASENAVHVDQHHLWHLAQINGLSEADHDLLMQTAHLVVNLGQDESKNKARVWWNELTARGGEGMVVKPLSFLAWGKQGLIQPALKCRGSEYLRLIYGPDYLDDQNLSRLRQRALTAKRSLASREFALGVEALERFVRGEPLRRVHECVFGVLALESEPVDPRL